MIHSLRTHSLAAIALGLSCVFSFGATQPSAPSANETAPSNKQFEPYQFLIGEWEVKQAADEPAAAVIRVKWGPNHSYIWYSSSLLMEGQEAPHLEGILVWNGVHGNLDMLFSMDLRGGRVQEQGTMSAASDGSLVRDITAVYGPGVQGLGMPAAGAKGTTAHFRETYKKVSDNKILTSAMRQGDDGWVPTFPGSDHLIMIRKGS